MRAIGRSTTGLWVALALALGACGSSGGDEGPINTPTVCDPVAQTGCEPGQKCANVTLQENPTIAKTDCVPQGTVIPGGECERGAAGADTGYDDCLSDGSGYDCVSGVCTEICRRTASTDSCTTAATSCVELRSRFTETALTGVGVCRFACDPVAQDCPNATQACFLNLLTQQTTCEDTIPEADSIDQDEECYKPDGTACVANGCPKGYGAVMFDNPPTKLLCGAFCRPVNTHSGAQDNAAGDPADVNCGSVLSDPTRKDPPGAAFQCRHIHTMYAGVENVRADIGVCASKLVWGDCTQCVLSDLQTTCNPLAGGAPGCFSREFIESL